MLDSQPSPPRSRVHLGTPPCTPRAPGRAPVYTFQTLTLAHVGPSRALHSATPYLHTLYPHTTRAYLDPLCQSQPSSSQLDPLPSSRAYLDLDPLSISAYMCDLPCIAWSHDTRTCRRASRASVCSDPCAQPHASVCFFAWRSSGARRPTQPTLHLRQFGRSKQYRHRRRRHLASLPLSSPSPSFRPLSWARGRRGRRPTPTWDCWSPRQPAPL